MYSIKLQTIFYKYQNKNHKINTSFVSPDGPNINFMYYLILVSTIRTTLNITSIVLEHLGRCTFQTLSLFENPFTEKKSRQRLQSKTAHADFYTHIFAYFVCIYAKIKLVLL